MGQPPGFFGKMPSHGDFVGRRLPPDVRQCFDDWLQASLVRSKQDLGDEWLPIWLSSPLWRFVVGAGVCGEQAWAGVMMPSHDRVGRCFPLLLMAGVDSAPSLWDCLTVHDAWFRRLEELALSTLDNQFSLQAFDAELLEVTVLLNSACTLGIGSLSNPPEMQPVTAAARTMPLVGTDAGRDDRSTWWTEGTALGSASLAIFDGLPPATAFAGFLDSRLNRHAHHWGR